MSTARGEFHHCVEYRCQRTVLVEGAAGVGRTAFLRLLTDELTDYDALPIRAHCSRAERDVRFAVLQQLLQSRGPAGAPEEPPARPERSALERTLLMTPDSSVGIPLLQHEVFTELRAIAEQRPLVILLDDIQFMDDQSADCLLYSLRRMQSLPVLVVVSDTHEAGDVGRFRGGLPRLPNGLRRIGLNPLSAEAVKRVVAARLGAEAVGLSEYCHAVTGGNGLLLHAILDDLAAQAGRAEESSGTGAGTALGRAVLHCLESVGASAVDVAHAMVVLGPGCSVNHIASLAELRPASVRRLLEQLANVELVVGDDFRHEEIRCAVARQMTPHQRAALHLRAAHLLIRHGASSRDLALHLLEADSIEAAWAIPTLHEAACQAGASGDPEFARSCLELALTDERERGKTKGMLLELSWRSDPAEADLHVPGMLELLELGRLQVNETLILVRHLLWHGRVAEAAHVLSRVGSAADFPSSEAAIRDFRVWLEHAYPPMAQLLRDLPRREAVPGSPLDGADIQSMAVNMLSDVLTNRSAQETVPEARQILQSRLLPELTFFSTQSALLALVFTDQLAEAAQRCDRLLAEAASLAAPTWEAVLLGIRAEIHRRCGALGPAARLARQALERMTEESWGVPIAQPMCSLLLTDVVRGRLEEARELFDRAVPSAIAYSAQGLVHRYACGHYQLAVGAVEQALQSFVSCGELAGSWNLDMPTVAPWREGAAEALVRLGRKRDAAELLHEQLELTSDNLPRARGITLRRQAALVDPREARALLTTAAQLLEVAGDRFELIRALTDLSHVLSRLGDSRRARVQAQLATQITMRLEAEEDSPAPGAPPGAGTRPAPSHPRRGPAPSLTDAEQRVAALAAQGLTNREIAQRLFVTPSTVEQHLTRIFRKLNVKQRSELSIRYGVHGAWVASAHP